MLHLTKILALVLILVLILKINEVIMIIPTILAQTVTSCQKELLQTNSSRIVHTNTVTGGGVLHCNRNTKSRLTARRGLCLRMYGTFLPSYLQ